MTFSFPTNGLSRRYRWLRCVASPSTLSYQRGAITGWSIRGARANSGPVLSERVRIWRSPQPFNHTKLMVVDAVWCLIGSANWDIRSFRLNFELCMEIYDRDLANDLIALMQARRGSPLTTAALDARPLLVKLRDAGARLMLPYL